MFQRGHPHWRGSQVVRPGSAKPLFVGSIPTRASSLNAFQINSLKRIQRLLGVPKDLTNKCVLTYRSHQMTANSWRKPGRKRSNSDNSDTTSENAPAILRRLGSDKPSDTRSTRKRRIASNRLSKMQH